MTALLIVAHGSRKKESNQEVLNLAAELQQIAGDHYSTVQCAFVQFGQPPFLTKVEELAGMGVREIKVLPYFIAAGSHVQQDIPELIQTAKNKHPSIRFRLMKHFGSFGGILRFILDESLKDHINLQSSSLSGR